MDIIKFISDHTLIAALIFIVVFILIRFYIYPKIRDSNDAVKVEEPFDTSKYSNLKK